MTVSHYFVEAKTIEKNRRSLAHHPIIRILIIGTFEVIGLILMANLLDGLVIERLGVAVVAAMGALSGKMADYGIDDDFIKSVREQVTEGTSALFLLTSDAVRDKVADAIKGEQFELIASNLTKEQEEELMATFSAV